MNILSFLLITFVRSDQPWSLSINRGKKREREKEYGGDKGKSNQVKEQELDVTWKDQKSSQERGSGRDMMQTISWVFASWHQLAPETENSLGAIQNGRTPCATV